MEAAVVVENVSARETVCKRERDACRQNFMNMRAAKSGGGSGVTLGHGTRLQASKRAQSPPLSPPYSRCSFNLIIYHSFSREYILGEAQVYRGRHPARTTLPVFRELRTGHHCVRSALAGGGTTTDFLFSCYFFFFFPFIFPSPVPFPFCISSIYS